eukprot:548357-Amphidinium_carterae.1
MAGNGAIWELEAGRPAIHARVRQSSDQLITSLVNPCKLVCLDELPCCPYLSRDGCSQNHRGVLRGQDVDVVVLI